MLAIRGGDSEEEWLMGTKTKRQHGDMVDNLIALNRTIAVMRTAHVAIMGKLALLEK